MDHSTVVIGTQWGDEGKGKIVDFLSEEADLVVRFNGGNNAGHTVKVGDQTFKFHILPSGVVRDKAGVIANGLVVDPKVLIEEMEMLRKAGRKPSLFISEKAHVVMDYHRVIDSREDRKCRIGTTGRGIGPTYSDKARRTEALRVGDLVNGEFRERLGSVLESKKEELTRLGIVKGRKGFENYRASMFEEYESYAKMLKPYVTDTTVLINRALDDGRKVLFEGAQGILLDVDHGSFPYVTSSNTCTGGVCTGAGVAPGRIKRVIGVTKSYTTRVGEGPFPTELSGEEGDRMREKGKEFGTTTGRPRRCGWIDLVILRYARMINGMSELAITKLDVLGGFRKLKVCVAYEIDGNRVVDFPSDSRMLERARPVYTEMDGWNRIDEEKVRKEGYSGLPGNARKYVESIEREVGVRASIISYGPERRKTIVRSS